MSMRYPVILAVLVLTVQCGHIGPQTKRAANGSVENPPEEELEGMVWIPGGEFVMGTDSPQSYAHERPAHRVRVDGFWMDATEVTNAQFMKFAEATGYVTVAERMPAMEEIMAQLPPGTPQPHDSVLVAGSLLFEPPSGPVPLDDISQWWTWTEGVNWRRPEGPQSSVEGKEDYPVVHIALEDARAYCEWAGRRLPTEAEYEFALHGGTENQAFSWGPELRHNGRYMANTFQGLFPFHDTGDDGFTELAPVRQYPPNQYGLYDIVGNAWEWTSDRYHAGYYTKLAKEGVAVNPGGSETYYDPQDPYSPRHVTKGGSFLCADDFCVNYRASARQSTSYDSGASHIGFRCVANQASSVRTRGRN